MTFHITLDDQLPSLWNSLYMYMYIHAQVHVATCLGRYSHGDTDGRSKVTGIAIALPVLASPIDQGRLSTHMHAL